ncbi:MAG: crotonase/enoyl-CoA hydratase family protein [Alphaproteobacteria bacterium]
MSTYETIKTDVKDGVLTLTLHRPDNMNAFTLQMSKEMIDVFEKANTQDDVRAIIVTGEGRAFCAGADLASGGDTFNASANGKKADDAPKPISTRLDETDLRIRDSGGLTTLSIFNCYKPVIGAINGAAVGIGATMQLPMDMRLASTKAKFGFVFARRGIVPEAASSFFLPRLVGPQQAMDWTLSGRVFDAEEAHKGGLVHELYAPEDLLPAAYEKARDIAENTSAISVALIRQMMWRGLTMSHPMEAHQIDSRGVAATGQSPEAMEGVMSFLEKRPPNFPGKVSTDMPDFWPFWNEPEYK